MWNILRLTADMLHVFALVNLMLRIRSSKSCVGISRKTQEIYLVVFSTRYLDLLYNFQHQNFYLIFMKLFFITSTIYIIALMKFIKPYCETYKAETDKVKHWVTMIPVAALLAFLVNRDWTLLDYIWSFSIWLEAIAILPQIYVTTHRKQNESVPVLYVASLFLYRLFYFFNWIYRYYKEDYISWTSVLGGILQTLLYAGLTCSYIKKEIEFKSEYVPPSIEESQAINKESEKLASDDTQLSIVEDNQEPGTKPEMIDKNEIDKLGVETNSTNPSLEDTQKAAEMLEKV